MAKSKKSPKPRDAYPKLPAQQPIKAAPPQTHAVRETVESIVIAFVLAFLFRTFEAEAFVIPTGSMAPTLMGRHKDVDCPKCGYRYQVSASEEESDDPHGIRRQLRRRHVPDVPLRDADGCQTCRQTCPSASQAATCDHQRSYNGDRILVNKYIYTFSDPQRWDVVVFKFPGDAKMNYIKRLVGLPGETLRIYQGDLFVGERRRRRTTTIFRSRTSRPTKCWRCGSWCTTRTTIRPSSIAAGWPLRWHVSPAETAGGWKLETDDRTARTVRQRYTVDAGDQAEAWLRYEHLRARLRRVAKTAQLAADTRARSSRSTLPHADREQLAASADHRFQSVQRPLDAEPCMPAATASRIDPLKQGLHWVGDLMVEADVEVESKLAASCCWTWSKAGRHFSLHDRSDDRRGDALGRRRCRSRPTAKTSIDGAGKYRVAFANVDDQLLLWVDGDVGFDFDGGTAYDVEHACSAIAEHILPQTSDEDPGDLAPAGIGGARREAGRDSAAGVARHLLHRRQIANESLAHSDRSPISAPTFDMQLPRIGLPDREHWDRIRRPTPGRFSARRGPVLRDGRQQPGKLRRAAVVRSTAKRGRPGGDYLERRLLIGKALCVYWPHSWNRIPGTPIPFPLFPNFGDMRLVR